MTNVEANILINVLDHINLAFLEVEKLAPDFHQIQWKASLDHLYGAIEHRIEELNDQEE